jgi:hypothetical protein
MQPPALGPLIMQDFSGPTRRSFAPEAPGQDIKITVTPARKQQGRLFGGLPDAFPQHHIPRTPNAFRLRFASNKWNRTNIQRYQKVNIRSDYLAAAALHPTMESPRNHKKIQGGADLLFAIHPHWPGRMAGMKIHKGMRILSSMMLMGALAAAAGRAGAGPRRPPRQR